MDVLYYSILQSVLTIRLSCGANNFSRRDECFKCHAQRPGGGGGGSSSSRRGGSSGGGSGGGYRGDSRRDRYDDNRGRSSSGRDDYRKDSRHERRDRPY